MAQHHSTASETPSPQVPQSSRFGSELPSVEDDVDIWCYAILELHARNNNDDGTPPFVLEKSCKMVVILVVVVVNLSK